MEGEERARAKDHRAARHERWLLGIVGALKGLNCPVSNLSFRGPQASAHVQQQNNGQRQPVLAEMRNRLLDSVLVDDEVFRIQIANGAPGRFCRT